MADPDSSARRTTESPDDESPFTTVASGATWVLGGRILKLVLLFLMQIVMARVLGSFSYGGVVIASTVMGIGVILGKLGIDKGVVRKVPQYEGHPKQVRGVLHAGVKISTISSVILSLCLFAFASPIATHVFDDESIATLLRIAAVGIPFAVLTNVSIAVSKSVRNARTHVVVKQLFSPVARFLLIGGLVLAGFGAVGAVIGFALSAVLSGGLALILAIRSFPIETSGDRRPMYGELFAFSLPLLFAAGMDFLINNTDTILLGVFLSSDRVGIYGVAFQLRTIGLSFFYPVTFLLPPVLTRLQKQHERREMSHVYQVATKWMTLSTYPLFLLVFLFPELVIRASFGPEYTTGAMALRLLIVPILITVVMGANGAALIALGHNRINLYVNGAASGVNLVLNVLLIPTLGIVGAAVASALAFVLRDVAYTVLLYRWHSIHPFSRPMIGPLAGSSLVASAVYLVFTNVADATLVSVAGAGVLFLCLYGPLVVRLGGIESVDVQVFGQFEESMGVELTRVRNIVRFLSSQ